MLFGPMNVVTMLTLLELFLTSRRLRICCSKETRLCNLVVCLNLRPTVVLLTLVDNLLASVPSWFLRNTIERCMLLVHILGLISLIYGVP